MFLDKIAIIIFSLNVTVCALLHLYIIGSREGLSVVG